MSDQIKRNMMIAFRASEDEAVAIAEAARASGDTRSDLIRRAVMRRAQEIITAKRNTSRAA